MSDPHKLEVVRVRRSARFRCPCCNNVLPVSEWTECDNCGAHLELKVDVVAPPIGE